MKIILAAAFSLLFLTPSAFADWTWSLQTDVGSTGIRGIDALSMNEVWATGYNLGSTVGSIYFYDGSDWSVQTSFGSSSDPRRMRAVSAADSNNVWAVGYNYSQTAPRYGYVYHFNGSTWSLQTQLNETYLWAVSALDASHVWSGGRSGDIYYFNGSSWSLQTDLGSGTVRNIDAYNENNVWAAASYGEIYYYNGSTWAMQTDVGGDSVRDVSALDANHVWAVSSDNNSPSYIWFYNGSSWALQTQITGASIRSIFALDASNVWAAGRDGVIYYFNGASWSLQTDVSVSYVYSLSGATGAGMNSIWASTSGGEIFNTQGRAIPEPSTALLLLLIAPGLLPFAKRLRR